MKRLLSFIFPIFISIISVSAKELDKESFSYNFENYDYGEDRVVYVKGYYIISYSEKDILEQKMNEELKRQGRSYAIPIDLHYGANCYSLQVYNRSLFDAVDIAPLFRVRRLIYNLEIFKFPSYKWIKPIETLFNNHENLKSRSEEIINKQIDFPDADYYKLENDSIVCKIYYIEGRALRKKVETDYLNLLNDFELSPYRLSFPPIPNGHIAAFFMYLFYDVDVIDPSMAPAGFIKWEPEYSAKDLDKLERYQKRKNR